MIQLVPDEAAREAIAFNATLETALAALPSLHAVPPALVRAARRAGTGIFRPPVVLAEAAWVDAGGVKLRVVRPPGESRGVYLHLHGGGWMLGAADMQDADLRALAHATGLVVASVEYRLAPEHPFPAAIDDCERAARWVVGGGLGTPGWFALGGESAGAHLAALVLQRVRGFAKANLVYGGALDPLLDDTLFMFERWRAAGSGAELRVWPHGVHGFNGFTLALGRLADADQHAWLAA